ncbi:hypothetical protein KAR91_15280 [Candidatus Pacearchaeota archaeon]|nr:hypothetical protein [Candidatus Pacearchaeota archaeon]
MGNENMTQHTFGEDIRYEHYVLFWMIMKFLRKNKGNLKKSVESFIQEEIEWMHSIRSSGYLIQDKES